MDDLADHGSDCTEALREVEAFLDGEIAAGLRARIQLHLADCSPCMGRAEFRKHLKDLVHDKCAGEAVPDDVVAKIRDLINRADTSP